MDQGSTHTFGESINFTENFAIVGGALMIRSCDIWSLDTDENHTKVIFLGNEAEWGSAVAAIDFTYVSTTQGSNMLQNITFERNRATQGGTFLWLCPMAVSNISEPPGLSTEASLEWIENEARYGPKVWLHHLRKESKYLPTRLLCSHP